MINFNLNAPCSMAVGDRVQFTAGALKTCDPAITLTEMQGTITQINHKANTLTVQFDDGGVATYHASLFDLIAH